MAYTPTIGLEIHAELLTDSKLFCGCENNPNADMPNEHVCPVCMGYPGALPYINKSALTSMLRVGIALDGDVADFTEFDRKHYFYPDIPKGYQISQYEHPLVSGGSLAGVAIERIHLEEDTAKSAHDAQKDLSVIDFNRSGVPLMELVTKPVMHSADEAVRFAEFLQQTLRYLGVSEARMEWGEMRVEANISVSKDENLGRKVEIKNLNSFKAVRSAIVHETVRQAEVLEGGGTVAQETRGWNENTGKTFSQRMKETSQEYRYMPEPDLPKLHIGRVPGFNKEDLKKTIPELPEGRLHRYTDVMGIAEEQAMTLMKNRRLGDLFDAIVARTREEKMMHLAANYLTSDLAGYAEKLGEEIFDKVNPDNLGELIEMAFSGDLSSRGAKDVLAVLVVEGGPARSVAEKGNLFQRSDEGFLLEAIRGVMAKNEKAVADYRAGSKKSLQFLVGMVMRETKGSANPTKVQKLLKGELENGDGA